jgi:omega-hydroxy-beta-dihydromenaquinone-9 sulfotransferase
MEFSPVFVIGHWRSGTTLLQRLLMQHSNHCGVSTQQAVLPELFLTPSPFRALFRRSVPAVRPMDQMSLGPDESEEDEYALANLGVGSFYVGLSFPGRMREIFDRWVLFEDVDEDQIARWKTTYGYFLRKVSMASGGRRLILRNPANTGRIRQILEMFPDARFVFIHRDPSVVFPSTMNWLGKELDMSALQRVTRGEVEEVVLANYEKLTRRYIETRRYVPVGQLAEVRFADLETDAVGETVRVCEELGLEMDSSTIVNIRRYAESLRGYQKNCYTPDPALSRVLGRRWGFAFDEWGYKRPAHDSPNGSNEKHGIQGR